MNGAEFLLRSIAADGTDHVFMVPGGLVDPFSTALANVPAVTPIVAAQEGGAAYAADGYARASGKFGACLVIGGPGLTNTVTAMSAALTDRVPLLLVSGEVATFVEGLGFFQDASAGTFDDTAVLRPVTAESFSIPDVRLLHHSYAGAIRRMFDGGRAPVHLSLPKDVQTGDVDVEPVAIAADLRAGRPLDDAAARDAFAAVAGDRPERIVVLAGWGVDDEADGALLVELAERFHLPVATTQLAKGTFPEDHALSLGVFGYAGGNRATTAILDAAPDLVIALGSAFNQRQSMHWTDQLAPRCGMIAVDTSAVPVTVAPHGLRFVHGHPGALLRWLAEDDTARNVLDVGVEGRRSWLTPIQQQPHYVDLENTTSDQVPIHPARLVTEARRVLRRDTIAVCDSGAHRAFAVHYWDSYGPREYLTAATLGPMGWALGAASGVAVAKPGRPVAVFTGDGCMQMHGLEVQTAARYGLRVIYLVSNNQALGNVWLRAHQLGPLPAELTTVPDHDWAAFARSLGCPGETVRTPDELAPALERAAAAGSGPYLLDVKTERDAPTPVEPYAHAAASWSYHE
ncbi:MAG: thiamine pyrophosphate-binding protein [Ilumatobacteraceae bacterium]